MSGLPASNGSGAQQDAGPNSTGKKEEVRESVRTSVKEWIELLVRAGVLACLIYAFFFQVSVVNGDSMEPTFKPEDRLLIDKLTYLFRDVERFDVVVFELVKVQAPAPKKSGIAGANKVSAGSNEVQPKRIDYIKRVVGLPGETVEYRNGRLLVNGQEIVEQEDLAGMSRSMRINKVWKVPEDRLVVIGDNRPRSLDSRSLEIGYVPLARVKGLVRVRFWPFERADWFGN